MTSFIGKLRPKPVFLQKLDLVLPVHLIHSAGREIFVCEYFFPHEGPLYCKLFFPFSGCPMKGHHIYRLRHAFRFNPLVFFFNPFGFLFIRILFDRLVSSVLILWFSSLIRLVFCLSGFSSTDWSVAQCPRVIHR